MKKILAFIIILTASARLSICEHEWLLGTGAIHDAAYSPNGQYLALVGDVGIHVYANPTLNLAQYIPIYEGLNFLKWSDDSNYIFVSNVTETNGLLHGMNNYLLNINNISLNKFDEKIKRYSIFRTINGPLSIPMIEPNYVDFSNTSNEVLFINSFNEIVIFSVDPIKVVDRLDLTDTPIQSAGFMPDNQLIWYHDIDNIFHIVSRLNHELISTRKHSKTITNISNDGKNIFTVVITNLQALINTTMYISDLDGLKSEVLSSSSSILDAGLLIPHPTIYIPNKNEYISLGMSARISTGVYRSFFNDQRFNNTLEISTNFATRFPHPYSADSKIYLAGDNVINYGGNLIFPNYDLYAVHWEKSSYEHILPNTSPNLILFDNTDINNFITHTNRITKQYIKWESINGMTETPNLTIIPNKYSNNITEIWSPDDHSLVNELQNKPFFEIGTFSYDNALFASPIEPISTTQTQINLYNTNSWEVVHELQIDGTNKVNSIGFSPDNQLFLATHTNIDIWNANTSEKMQSLIHHDGSVFHAVFSTDSQRILSAGNDGKVIESNLAANLSNTLIQESSPVIFADYIEDETQIIYTLNDGISKVFNLTNNTTIHTIPASLHDNSFRTVKLSADKQFIIVGNQIWKIVTAELVNTSAEYAESMEDLQVSSDGKWVASRHSDFTARVWSTDEIYQQHSSVKQFNNY